eukprot:TRINITY_DN2707_c0_g1_i2.p1 TRINITY_DN2707_c0_g1~~TRINITY_DN2707_c0_g1_i2.p1  ORF type:complete len:224 (+),score=31.11 TRINITY_DN2707_c0_g1_i2:1043-1714(+)
MGNCHRSSADVVERRSNENGNQSTLTQSSGHSLLQSAGSKYLKMRISEAQLQEKRETFWFQKHDNIREIWLSLKLVCESFLSEDFPTCDAVLSASNISGNFKGFYDEFRNMYEIPEYLFKNPKEFATEDVTVDEKGSQSVSVRVKIAFTEHEYVIDILKSKKVQTLIDMISKRVIEDPRNGITSYDPNNVRLLYSGRELLRTSSIQTYELSEEFNVLSVLRKI